MAARRDGQTGGGIAPQAAERGRAFDRGDAATVLNPDEISRRLDRLPLCRFHAGVLVIASASLLFDTVDIRGRLYSTSFGQERSL